MVAGARALGVVALLLVLAQATEARELQLAAGSAVVLVVVSALWAWTSLRGLSVSRRIASDRVQVGETFEDTIVLRNRSLLGKLWVELEDHSTLPGHRMGQVVHIGPRRSREWTVRSIARRRGRHTIGPVVLRSDDIFGLFRREKMLPSTVELLVYPLVLDVGGYVPPSALQSGGETRHTRSSAPTPTVGGVRDYVHGDPTNRISWTMSARTGRLMVKEFESDPAADVWIVLDTALPNRAADAARHRDTEAADPVAFLDSSFELGVALATSMVRRSLDAGRAVGLLTGIEHPLVIPPERSDRQYLRILEWLAVIGSRPSSDLLELMLTNHGSFRRDAGIILITQAADSRLAGFLQSLRSRRVHSDVMGIDGRAFGEPSVDAELLHALGAAQVPSVVVDDAANLAGILARRLPRQQSLRIDSVQYEHAL